jgi:hypothetical protein
LRDDLYYVVGGAALGAILGALGGWLYFRYVGKPRGKALAPGKEIERVDRSRLMRLGWSVVRVVREIVELRG